MYKFEEDKSLEEIKKYVDKTYDAHYSKGKYQATEMIIDSGHGEGFCIGNILKYAQRYGKKNGKNRAERAPTTTCAPPSAMARQLSRR